MRVEASNGWSADLDSMPGGELLLGGGEWTTTRTGKAVARRVMTKLSLEKGKLLLMMQILEQDGRRIPVRAVFERFYLGAKALPRNGNQRV